MTYGTYNNYMNKMAYFIGGVLYHTYGFCEAITKGTNSSITQMQHLEKMPSNYLTAKNDNFAGETVLSYK